MRRRADSARLAVLLCLLTTAAGCGGENLFGTDPAAGDAALWGRIEGQVTAAGVPVGGVWLIIAARRDSVATNAQGAFLFPNLPAATYDVSLRVPVGYTLVAPNNAVQRVEVPTAGAARLDWRLQQETTQLTGASF